MNQQRVMLSLGVALVCALGCGDDAASPAPHDVAITADAGDA